MFEALGHVGSGLAYLANARQRERGDRETARQLAWPSANPLPPGLELTWLGTAGFRIACEGTVVLVDPYITRLPLGALLRRKVVAADGDAIARWVDGADAVLVGHTHFDHALDVPAIARRFGCPVYGSTSLAHLMDLHGLREQTVVVEPRREYEIGPFRFHFVPSVHSKLALGLRVPSDGELTCEHLDELTPQAYRCGQVWGIAIRVATRSGDFTIYHQGSADLLEDEVIDRNVDVFLCGIAGRRFTPRYIERVMRALDPKLLVPTHFDDFFQPFEAPARFSFNVNLTGFADEVRAVSRDVPVHALAVHTKVGS